MLNPQSPMPLYHQLADILLAGIRAGEFPPDTRIPSELSLAASYGIGRPTVRQAIDLLVRKRILVRKRGSGTYVLTRQKEIDLFSLAGTTSAFHREGASVVTHILQKIRLTAIRIRSGKSFFRQERLFSFQAYPGGSGACPDRGYLSSCGNICGDRCHGPGRPVSFPDCGGTVFHAAGQRQADFQNRVCGRKQGRQIWPSHSTTPILLVKRFLHFPQAENAIYSELYCRTDQFVFSQTIGGMTDD